MLVLEITFKAIDADTLPRVVALRRDFRKCAPWEVAKTDLACYLLSEAVVAVVAVFIFD